MIAHRLNATYKCRWWPRETWTNEQTSLMFECPRSELGSVAIKIEKTDKHDANPRLEPTPTASQPSERFASDNTESIPLRRTCNAGAHWLLPSSLESAMNGSILVWRTCSDFRFNNTSYGLAFLFTLSLRTWVGVRWIGKLYHAKESTRSILLAQDPLTPKIDGRQWFLGDLGWSWVRRGRPKPEEASHFGPFPHPEWQ